MLLTARLLVHLIEAVTAKHKNLSRPVVEVGEERKTCAYERPAPACLDDAGALYTEATIFSFDCLSRKINEVIPWNRLIFALGSIRDPHDAAIMYEDAVCSLWPSQADREQIPSIGISIKFGKSALEIWPYTLQDLV